MQPETARAAIEARVEADLSLSSTTGERIDRLMESAARLRSLYRVQAGLQHAPFFEIHTGDFSLIAIDTGIERRLDRKQFAWLEAAVARSKGTFTMAIVGHPFYAAGLSQIGEGSFKDVHDLLKRNGVRVMMAGDTHDFEYYRERGRALFRQRRRRRLLEHRHVARWPDRPALGDYAFYPRTDAVSTKLDRRDAAVEMAGLVVDPAQRRVAVFRRSVVGGL